LTKADFFYKFKMRWFLFFPLFMFLEEPIMSCERVVDIGGTGIRRANVRNEVEISDLESLDFCGQVPSVETIVKFAMDNMQSGTNLISFACPGVIVDHSLVKKSPNIPSLNGVNLGKLFKEEPQVFCAICNDMEAAAAGMAELFSQLHYFLAITVSSGIGIRVVKDKEIISDSEGGHICIDYSPYAPLCGCGARGCAEAIVSGNAIERRIIDETKKRGIVIPDSMHPSAFFDDQLGNGFDWAIDIEEIFVEGMASYLSSLLAILHFPAIVWKGEFAQRLAKGVFTMIKDRMRKKLRVAPEWADNLEFYFSPHDIKDKDSLIGAAAIARKLRS
jgi:predicted NBD/HSP70 family sugar kinase